MTIHLAYIISAYKYPNLLARLIQQLHTPNSSFFVHVDKNSDDRIYDRMVRGIAGLPRVDFLERHACNWGGFGHVEATLKAIGAIAETSVPFDYAVLLTGQDYPIKSNVYIQKFFESAESRAFIDHFPLPSEHWEKGGLERVRWWHFRVLGRHLRLPAKRVIPNGFQPYGGSSYWCLPGACIAYLQDFVQNNPGFVDFFRHVDVPDELFFQTILLNSEWKRSVENENLHYVDWKDAGSGSPSVLTMSDFQQLARSAQLFARKFDPALDTDILEAIDRHLLAENRGAVAT